MHWLDEYGPPSHRWHTRHHRGRPSYYRRIGIVEAFFDTPGIDFEGLADCQSVLTIRTRERPSRDEVLWAWTYLRLKHALMMARAVDGEELAREGVDEPGSALARYFVVEPPQTSEEAVAGAASCMTWLHDTHPEASLAPFYHHLLNSARCIDPRHALSHLFVFPSRRDGPRFGWSTSYIFVHSHSITDGLTMFAWSAHFTTLFTASARRRVHDFIFHFPLASLHLHLHAAQEFLYPPVHPAHPARARWAWAITRVLRHLPKSLLEPFPNPTRRPAADPAPSRSLPPTYAPALSYARAPPIHTATARVNLSPRATARLKRLCREMDVSVGAGCFALLALTSMRLLELFSAADPSASTPRPFVTGFPLDFRSFLPVSVPFDGVTLGFSWGHVLPFLPSSLPMEPRFRLLARRANRQLGVYQKGARGQAVPPTLGAKSRAQAVRMLYLATVERGHARLPDAVRAARQQAGWSMPQGALPASGVTGAHTHGISNLGSLERLWRMLQARGEVEEDWEQPAGDDEPEVEMQEYEWSVRAREGEFLVGVAEWKGRMTFCASYDAGAMDEGRVDEWKRVLGRMLESDEDGESA